MKPSKQAIKALKFLNNWENKSYYYNLLFQDIELQSEFSEFEYRNEWFNFDFTKHCKDEF